MLTDQTQKLLTCPVCQKDIELINQGKEYRCVNTTCATVFPLIDGIPCLINENSSIFSIDGFLQHKDTTFKLKENKVKLLIQKILPSISTNIKAEKNYRKFAKALLKNSAKPKVLVIGGSILGQGIESLLSFSAIEIIETDVSFGPRTTILCDSHDLPFKNESFDGGIMQAVLEHVVDPYRCVEEAHRILKKGGLVYAETPFMQQVHAREYDFTRFTHLGHRRLFRAFEEIESGAVCGPGMALAWSYQYFLLSFAKSKFIRKIIMAFSRLTSFYLKYFDYFLINKKGTLDAASGYYFMGRKNDLILSDKALVKSYKGAF